MSGIHGYCRAQIKVARIEAKEKGVKIPPFGGSVLVGYEQYGVFLGDFYTEKSGCCAFEARKDAIFEFIDLREKGLIDEGGNKIKKES